nr:MAG TPA: hypothetical protein [Bacteriophage sp.]
MSIIFYILILINFNLKLSKWGYFYNMSSIVIFNKSRRRI